MVVRRDSGLHRWASWLQEDLASRPYAWLKPDSVRPSPPPSPFLVVKNDVAKTSQILVDPHLIDAEFLKAWMPFFCRSGHPVVTVDQFLAFVDPFFPKDAMIVFHRITGQDLLEVARAKRSTAGGLDGSEIKALLLAWCSGLAILLSTVELTGDWPQALQDAYIAMIPNADGDFTPLGQRPLSVLPEVYVFSLGIGLSSVEAWFSSALDIVISCMSWLLMSSSPLTLLIGLFWIVPWCAWVSLPGSGKSTSPTTVRFG